MPPSRTRSLALHCGAFVALFLWVLRPLWDIDVFFHIAIGREILAHGIPTTDIFSSATPNAPWTPFQLGYALLFALIDKLGGLDLVRVFDAALTAAAMTLLAQRFSRIAQSRAVAWLLFALFLTLYDDRIRPRPHLFNLLFEVSVLLPLARGELAVGSKRWLLGLLGIGAVWSFMHSMGALWLLAVLGTWLVAGKSEQRRWAAAALGFAFVGIVLAPGAAGGMIHVLRIQDQWREFVPELAPAWAFYGMGTLYGDVVGTLPWIAALLVGVAALQKPAREQVPALLCAAGFAFAALWLARLVYYAAFAIALVWPVLRASRWRERLAPARAAQLAVAVSCTLALLMLGHVTPRFFGRGINPWTTTLYPAAFPVQEADAIEKAGLSARAYNEMPWGGYLLYRLFPRVRVISDGRITFTRDVAELLRHERTTAPELVAEVAYRRFGIDMLIWRAGRMPPTRSWKLLMRGPLADVWARRPDQSAATGAAGTGSGSTVSH